MVLHIARFADRLFIHHNIDLSGQDRVTIKTAKMFQMPALTFCLGVLIAEYKLQKDKDIRDTILLTAQLFSSRMSYQLRSISQRPSSVMNSAHSI